MRRNLALTVAATLGLCFALTYQINAQAPGTMSGEDFVMKASQVDMAEIMIGKLATEKASRPAVKQFAQQMITDHTAATKELTPIATKKNLKLANKLDSEHQALFDKLQKMSGAEFDDTYASNMVAGHQKAVEMYKQESMSNSDADLKQFAAKTLPTVEHHLQMAKDIAAQKATPASK